MKFSKGLMIVAFCAMSFGVITPSSYYERAKAKAQGMYDQGKDMYGQAQGMYDKYGQYSTQAKEMYGQGKDMYDKATDMYGQATDKYNNLGK